MIRTAPFLRNLTGLWRRSVIVWPDGERDATTRVHWLQGPGLYVDLRQPAGGPDLSHARGLDDLNRDELLWLAHQEAFAGALCREGDCFEWRHELDFQPRAARADRGRLWFEGGMLIEQGTGLQYIEHWQRGDYEIEPCAAARLYCEPDKIVGVLVRCGPFFMYARDRAAPLPDHPHLADCVRATRTLAAARSCLDFEVSLGRVSARGWIIERSSLPFRAGHMLEPRECAGAMRVMEVDGCGAPLVRTWRVTELQGAFADLLTQAELHFV